MELSFVYDSLHFAPTPQQAEPKGELVDRVLLEAQSSSAAKEAKAALNSAEEAFRSSNLVGAMAYYAVASRHYLTAAEGVHDEKTALMLMFLANTVARRAEELRQQLSLKPVQAQSTTPGTAQNKTNTSSAPATRGKHNGGSIVTPPFTDRLQGRLAFEGVRKKLKDLDRLPDASPALTCVEDLMHLERKLEELGLTQDTVSLRGDEHFPCTRYRSVFVQPAWGEASMTQQTASPNVQGLRDMSTPTLKDPSLTRIQAHTGGGDGMSMSVYLHTHAQASPPTGNEAAHVAQVQSGTMSLSASIAPKIHAGENVARLLRSMETLGKENAKLLAEREQLISVQEENKQVRREMDLFKRNYRDKFAKLRKLLQEFASKYPHEHNPANAITKVETLNRVTDLERTVRSLVDRLEKANASIEKEREDNKKKEETILKFQQFYKQLRQSALSRQSRKRDVPTIEERPEIPMHANSRTPYTQEVRANGNIQPAMHTHPQAQHMHTHSTKNTSAHQAQAQAQTQRPLPQAHTRGRAAAPRPSTATLATSLSSSGVMLRPHAHVQTHKPSK